VLDGEEMPEITRKPVAATELEVQPLGAA